MGVSMLIGMAELRYRCRMRVNATERNSLQAVFKTNRFVRNQALGRWEDLWRYEDTSFSYGAANKELTGWRSRFEWLAAVELAEQPCVAQQQVLGDLYRSISAFFDKANPANRLHFKSKRREYATARWTKRGFKMSGGGLGICQTDRLWACQDHCGCGSRILLWAVWSRPLAQRFRQARLAR